MSNIAIFASGSGSNAEQIIRYFDQDPDIHVLLVLCNKPDAFVLGRARNLNIRSIVFDRKAFYQSQSVLDELRKASVDLIVLAGFLWMIPDYLLKSFSGRILNIHPALLPDFGGKGMYGMRVHEEVIRRGQKKSGITIHLVDEHYDHGRTIFQAECEVLPDDTPDSLATRIHALEHRYYPQVIRDYLKGSLLPAGTSQIPPGNS
ncbi:MAG: phosphoribosylglycinamide formyltransferase [Bacteroidota bacterium]